MRLTEVRWFIPTISLLYQNQGARFIELTSSLGISSQSLSRTLGYMAHYGWVVQNPGHGHPLRPEYVLTDAGALLGQGCSRISAATEKLGLAPRDVPRWSLPIAADLSHKWMRFGMLQQQLEPATPRALSMTLKSMIGQDLVDRRLDLDYARVPFYGLTRRGEVLARAALG